MIQFSDSDRQWIYNNYPDYHFIDRQTIKTAYLSPQLAYRQPDCPGDHKYNCQKLQTFGGNRLTQFYLSDCNYELAAQILNIRVSTLRTYICRLREKLLELGISPLIFDKICRQEK